jgi:hypothetical protein
LVNDFDVEQKTVLIKPDYNFYLGMKPGMLPIETPNRSQYPYYPPYMANIAMLRINKALYKFKAQVTSDHLWKITILRGLPGTTTSAAKAGDMVDFVVMGTAGWFVQDVRSEMGQQIAKEYATILNHFQADAHYDGSGWSNPLGPWQLRKFTQMVYEHMVHPAPTGSSSGVPMFGNFEYQFKKVQSIFEGSKSKAMPIVPSDSASLASSMDDVHHSLNLGVWSNDMNVRGNHRGLTVADTDELGIWEKALKTFRLWSEMKPYMSDDQKEMISTRKRRVVKATTHDVFVASETDDQWLITRKRAMRREGIDSPWRPIPERPELGPRQFMKANGETIEGLENPYQEQTADLQLHVMPSMSTAAENNISLMPKKAGDIMTSKKTTQTLSFRDGVLNVSYDNSKSKTEHISYWDGKNYKGHKNFTQGRDQGYWPASAVVGKSKMDTEKTRGISMTIEGDGSGAILLFSVGPSFPRTFRVPIDFVGKRTFEIPNGEVLNNLGDWNVFGGQTITHFKFYNVTRFTAYFHRVPAGKKAKVKILEVKAMMEDHETGLIDPVLNLNGKEFAVHATIPYNHYLEYAGGEKAKVYGPNWNYVKEVPVSGSDFTAKSGKNSFSVTSVQSPNTFVSTRIRVQDGDFKMQIDKHRK